MVVAPPPGTWAQIPNTAVYPAQPFEAKPESAPGGVPELWSPYGLFAFSGGDLWQRNGVWGFLLAGGGHGDSPDMSLYWVPFDESGPQRLTGPFLAEDHIYHYDSPWETYRGVSRNQPPTTPPGMVPKARHTYHSIVCAQQLNLAFMVGGSITGTGGGTDATRTFDLTQTYAQAMARADMGWMLRAPAPGGTIASTSGWDPVQGRFVTRSRNFLGWFDPVVGHWGTWPWPAEAPGGSDFVPGVAMDIAGRVMYVVGDRLAESIDLDTGAWTDLRSRPWATMTGNAIAWHPGQQKIISWWGGQGLTLIDPVTDSVAFVSLGGATVTPMESSGTFGRFRLLPGTDQVVLLNRVEENVCIGTIDFAAATTDPTPPPSQETAMTGYFLGITGEDKVGQGGQTTPNGTPDWHLLLQNVTSDPVAVQIEAFLNGSLFARWSWPFNGMHWVLAKEFAAGQLDLWCEPYQSPTTFNVQVTYADGTTAAVTNISSVVSTPPPPTGRVITVTIEGIRPDLGDVVHVVTA